jgi:hypothetical protein
LPVSRELVAGAVSPQVTKERRWTVAVVLLIFGAGIVGAASGGGGKGGRAGKTG